MPLARRDCRWIDLRPRRPGVGDVKMHEHLVHRLPFLFPLYKYGPYRPWFVQSGVLLYSTLARAKLNGLVEIERARRMVPDLQTARLRSCALYADAWTNDSRRSAMRRMPSTSIGGIGEGTPSTPTICTTPSHVRTGSRCCASNRAKQ